MPYDDGVVYGKVPQLRHGGQAACRTAAGPCRAVVGAPEASLHNDGCASLGAAGMAKQREQRALPSNI